jgi:hypothetical protein
MDRLDAGDQTDVLDIVRERVRGKLGVVDPTVLAAAPKSVVRHLTGERLSVEERGWVTSFSALQKELRSRMSRERKSMINSRALALTDETLAELEPNVGARKAELDAHELALQILPICDLDTFVDEQRAARLAGFERSMKYLRRTGLTVVSEIEESFREYFRDELDTDSSKDSLNTSMRKRIPRTLAASLAELQERLRREVSGPAEAALSAEGTRLDEELLTAYRTLRNLSVRPLPAVVTATAHPRLATIGRAEMQSLPSDALGGWLGNIFGPSLAKLRARYLNEVSDRTTEIFAQVRTAVTTYVDTISSQGVGQLSARCTSYLIEYRPVVKTAIKMHQHERKRVHTEWERLSKVLDEVSQRRNTIEEARLAITSRHPVTSHHHSAGTSAAGTGHSSRGQRL